MPPKKHSSSLEGTRRSKRLRSTRSLEQNKLLDITRQNSLHSPLLRLPREVRDQIYSYLYANLVLHRYPFKGFAYSICHCALTPRERYTLSLRGASTLSPHLWASDVLEVEGKESHSRCKMDNTAIQFYVPLVCKQFWVEVDEMIWKTATWYFDRSSDFKDFARIDAVASRAQQICLMMQFNPTGGYGPEWPSTITNDTMDRFENLQGIDILLVRVVNKYESGMDLSSGLLEGNQPKEFKHIGECLEVLQRRKWKEDRVSVLVEVISGRRAPITWRGSPSVIDEGPVDLRTPVEDRLKLATMVMNVLVA